MPFVRKNGLAIGALLLLAIAGCAARSDTIAETAALTTIAPTTTAATPPLPDGLFPLVDGHNDLASDRINLVFVPHGWNDLEEFIELSEDIVTFGGEPLLIDAAGEPTELALEATRAEFGPFAIEPWRSNRGRFNLWYTLDEPAEPVAYTSLDIAFPIDVPDAVLVTLAVDWPHGAASGFTDFIPPQVPDRSRPAPPIGLTIGVDSLYPYDGLAPVLAHELAHAVFGLSDEYVGEQLGFDRRPDLSSYPACAKDEAEAVTWWGERLGSVDPMFDIWMDELTEVGLGFDATSQGALRAEVTVDLVDGGCYGPPGSIRATRDSLMNNNLPVLGTVNRDWAERVLAEWSGQ